MAHQEGVDLSGSRPPTEAARRSRAGAKASRSVIAVAAGGPASLVQHRATGMLCAPSAGSLADALLELAAAPLLRERLALAALGAVRERSWESALQRLAHGYGRLLAEHAATSADAYAPRADAATGLCPPDAGRAAA